MTDRVPKDAIPAPVVELAAELRAHGFRAWIVGGCLRDVLLGRQVSDWDLATSAKPEEITRTFRKVIPTGIAHGTVTVRWRGTSYEVTTLRGEGAYSDGRRPDEVFFVEDIREDLARRDFTVNAIALDPVDGSLIDPFGGLRDLEAGILRAVGVAKERFGEDGLRVLRAARFVATLGLELEPGTEAAIDGSLDTYRKVSKERIRDEWVKTMKAKTPSRAFEVMRRTGILAVTFPEMLAMVGCEQNRFHAFDVWQHSMAVLDGLDGTAVEKMAALLHDVGKPPTRALSEKTEDYTFYEHEKIGADMADKWLRTFRFSNAERDTIVHLVRQHLVCYSSDWTDAAVRRFLRRVGPENVSPLLRLARSDAAGKGRPVEDELRLLDELEGRASKELERGTALGVTDLAVSGADVLAHLEHGAGPAVGAILRHLLDLVVDDPTWNDRERLLARVAAVAPEMEAANPRVSRGEAT